MTRTEATAQFNEAAARKDAAWKAARSVGFSDIALATRLHDEAKAADAAYKVAYANRTKYAPAI